VRVSGFASLAVLLTISELAEAEPARVTLTYERKDTAATSCPDEATFRTLVLARLGYDPFDKAASSALRVELRPLARDIVGRFVLADAAGKKQAERTLRDADCFEVASTLALAAAIAVDPEAVRAGGAPPPRDPPPGPVDKPGPPPPDRPTPPRPVPHQEPRSLWSPSAPGALITAAFVMPVGLTPAPRGGIRAGVGVEGQVWSVAAEGVFYFPSSHTEPFGTVSSFIAHGSVVPCAHLPVHAIVSIDLCTVGSVGAMFSDASEVSRADAQTHLFATVGPRGGVTVEPTRWLGIAAALDAPVNLARAQLYIEDRGTPREAWAASRVGFVGGLGLVMRVP